VKNRLGSASNLESRFRRKFLGKVRQRHWISIVPRGCWAAQGMFHERQGNIAFIGVGSQGLRVMLQFLREADVQGVAVCDRIERARTTRNGTHEFLNSVRNCSG